jgi:hypothetical protein
MFGGDFWEEVTRARLRGTGKLEQSQSLLIDPEFRHTPIEHGQLRSIGAQRECQPVRVSMF